MSKFLKNQCDIKSKIIEFDITATDLEDNGKVAGKAFFKPTNNHVNIIQDDDTPADSLEENNLFSVKKGCSV